MIIRYIFAGIMWSIADISFFIANEILEESTSFPIISVVGTNHSGNVKLLICIIYIISVLMLGYSFMYIIYIISVIMMENLGLFICI